MKKIFTLLICLMGMTLAANANDITPVQDCINYLLSHHSNQTLMANNANTNMDANHDGIINISDVTFMITERIRTEQGTNYAPASKVDVKGLINEVLETETETPNIDDVTNAINNNLREE